MVWLWHLHAILQKNWTGMKIQEICLLIFNTVFLSGFFNFNNTLCGLLVAFVEFYTLFLKLTCDIILMWLHVDSVSISTLKS